jgi:hypothetical protein
MRSPYRYTLLDLQPPKIAGRNRKNPLATGFAGRCEPVGAPKGAPTFNLHGFRPHGSPLVLREIGPM